MDANELPIVRELTERKTATVGAHIVGTREVVLHEPSSKELRAAALIVKLVEAALPFAYANKSFFEARPEWVEIEVTEEDVKNIRAALEEARKG